MRLVGLWPVHSPHVACAFVGLALYNLGSSIVTRGHVA